MERLCRIRLINQGGHLLLPVLILLQVLTWLFLESLEEYSAFTRLSHGLAREQQWQLQGRAIANAIISRKIDPRHCVIAVQKKDWRALPLAWWQQHACSFLGSKNIYYLIEDLQKDTCALVNQNQIAHYYRLTFISLKSDVEWSDHFAQATFVMGEYDNAECQKKLRVIKAGIQSILFR